MVQMQVCKIFSRISMQQFTYLLFVFRDENHPSSYASNSDKIHMILLLCLKMADTAFAFNHFTVERMFVTLVTYKIIIILTTLKQVLCTCLFRGNLSY